MENNTAPTTFQGDFSTMWQLGLREPLWHMTWDWWWWLVMIDDPKGQRWGKQLMVLWSTKDNDRVEVNGTPWQPKGRPGVDGDGGMVLDGMVCAWWFDGQRMHEPYIKRTCNMGPWPMTIRLGQRPAKKAARERAVERWCRFFPTTSPWAFAAIRAHFG